MQKAWSFFWLVVAAIVVIYIVVAIIGPWMPLVIAGVVLSALVTIALLVRRFIRNRRRFF